MTETDVNPSMSADAQHKAARQQGSVGSSGLGNKGANNEAPHALGIHVASQGDRVLFSDAAPLVTPSQEPFSGSQLEQLNFAVSQLPPVMLSQGEQLPGPSQDLLGNATQGSQSIEQLMAQQAAAAAEASRLRTGSTAVAASALKGGACVATASDAAAQDQKPSPAVLVSSPETQPALAAAQLAAQLVNNPTHIQALQELVKGAETSTSDNHAFTAALAALAASGTVIPTPQGPPSGGQLQQPMPSSLAASPAVTAATAAMAAAAATTAATATDLDALQQQQHLQFAAAAAAAAAQYPQYLPAVTGIPQQYGIVPQPRHASVAKPEHAGSMAKRRGPMDEMRQLQRILTKLLPASAGFMPSGVDGGGNKVQAEQIKIYLAATLGEAPKPDWGLKNGWGQYLADLFNWATGRHDITNYMAMDTARRQQGRSWEVLHDKLMDLGVFSWNWELPLRLEQVRNCPKGPPPELQRQQAMLAAATAANVGGAHSGAGRRSSGSVAAASPAVSAAAMQQQLLAAYPNTGAGMLATAEPPAPTAAVAADSAPPTVNETSDSAAANAAAAIAAARATAELDQAAKARRAARSTSSSGGISTAIPAAAADPSAAAALAAAAVSSSAHFKLPSQEELNGGTCLQLLEFVSRCLNKATQAVQNKAASPGTEPHHNATAVSDRLSSVVAQVHKFTTLMGNVSNMYTQRTLHEITHRQQLHQQQMEQKAAAAAAPLPPTADVTEAAAAVAAAAAGTAGAGTSAAAGTGASHTAGSQQQQQQALFAEQVQQIAQLIASSQSQPGGSQPNLLHAFLQQSQQQQPALAAIASQGGNNAHQPQDRAAAAAVPAVAAGADNQQQQQQQQQQPEGAAVDLAAAAAAGPAGAGSAGLQDDDAGEEMALDVSLAGVHPAALGPIHPAAYAVPAVAASITSAVGAAGVAGGGGVGENRAWLAAMSAPISKPASSKVSAPRNSSFAQAAVAARAYAARGGQSRSRQQQHLQEGADEVIPGEASVTDAAAASHQGDEELNAVDAAELLLGIKGSQGTGVGTPIGSPINTNSSKRQVSSGRAGVGSLLGSKRKAEDEDDYVPHGH